MSPHFLHIIRSSEVLNLLTCFILSEVQNFVNTYF
uniref:Uncharacterized protein n=1 Tax=Caudovirales sp. ctIZM3 TaxID=2827633 RepID=A0A8S5T881_9CAUD|nr:MAG TPA: hypothetical protein [Caudovirales sp. ctIZM3]